MAHWVPFLSYPRLATMRRLPLVVFLLQCGLYSVGLCIYHPYTALRAWKKASDVELSAGSAAWVATARIAEDDRKDFGHPQASGFHGPRQATTGKGPSTRRLGPACLLARSHFRARLARQDHIKSSRDGNPPLHSMTLSARTRNSGGTCRPSASAVLKLSANSNLVGNSTGRSAGLVPFNILSTSAAARRYMSA